MIDVILASRSAARSSLLAAAGVPFQVQTADVDEDALKQQGLAVGHTPAQIAVTLADAKALAVSRTLGGLVIGADQTLDHDGELIDKADSLEEAKRHLLSLRGRRHQLHAAVAVAENGAIVWRDLQTASLTMRDFSDAFLDSYLAREADRLLRAVGCYQLEGAGVQLFERIDGDYFTILGLPLLNLLAFFRSRGVLTP